MTAKRQRQAPAAPSSYADSVQSLVSALEITGSYEIFCLLHDSREAKYCYSRGPSNHAHSRSTGRESSLAATMATRSLTEKLLRNSGS
jgi:hypothetical protein